MAPLELTTTAIKARIEKQGNITRQDVYDLLSKKKGGKAEEKRKFVKASLNSLSDKIKNAKSKVDGRKIVDKILDDLDSYPNV